MSGIRPRQGRRSGIPGRTSKRLAGIGAVPSGFDQWCRRITNGRPVFPPVFGLPPGRCSRAAAEGPHGAEPIFGPAHRFVLAPAAARGEAGSVLSARSSPLATSPRRRRVEDTEIERL